MLPEVPTFAEAGVAGVEAKGGFMLLAPAGTPRNIIARINTEANKVLALPEVQADFARQAITVEGGTADELGRQNEALNTRVQDLHGHRGRVRRRGDVQVAPESATPTPDLAVTTVTPAAPPADVAPDGATVAAPVEVPAPIPTDVAPETAPVKAAAA